MYRYLSLACLLAVATLLLGCGGYSPDKGVTVKGKITKGGVPLTVPNMAAKVGIIRVDLVPIHSGANDERGTAMSMQEPDGTFVILGDGKGVKPGKYKVSVVTNPGNGQDDLKGQFNGAASKIEVDISASNLGGTQDLGTLELDTYK